MALALNNAQGLICHLTKKLNQCIFLSFLFFCTSLFVFNFLFLSLFHSLFFFCLSSSFPNPFFFQSPATFTPSLSSSFQCLLLHLLHINEHPKTSHLLISAVSYRQSFFFLLNKPPFSSLLINSLSSQNLFFLSFIQSFFSQSFFFPVRLSYFNLSFSSIYLSLSFCFLWDASASWLVRNTKITRKVVRMRISKVRMRTHPFWCIQTIINSLSLNY